MNDSRAFLAADTPEVSGADQAGPDPPLPEEETHPEPELVPALTPTFPGVGTGLPDLMIDEVQMVQVLSNLLTNADHAIADSDRAGTIDIGARPGPRPGLVRLELADNGPGVPVDIAGRIFDPLFTTKAGGKGTGVGLALCHRIVAAHGGKIALMTRAPDGARFVIDLPAAPEDGGQAS